MLRRILSLCLGSTREYSDKQEVCSMDMGTIRHTCQTWSSSNPSFKKWGIKSPKDEAITLSQKVKFSGQSWRKNIRTWAFPTKHPPAPTPESPVCPKAILTILKDKKNHTAYICMTPAEKEVIYPHGSQASPGRSQPSLGHKWSFTDFNQSERLFQCGTSRHKEEKSNCVKRTKDRLAISCTVEKDLKVRVNNPIKLWGKPS